MGFTVLTPKTYRAMKKNGDFDEQNYRHLDRTPTKKSLLIKTHFEKVAKSDAILILNLEKNGMKGYIGGNVLMEMAVAFYLEKQVYILNEVDPKLPVLTEVQGVNARVLNGDLSTLHV